MSDQPSDFALRVKNALAYADTYCVPDGTTVGEWSTRDHLWTLARAHRALLSALQGRDKDSAVMLLLRQLVSSGIADEGNSLVDPAFAPPGCYAIPETDGCEGCVFEPDSGIMCLSRPCAASDRPDGQDVIFLPVAGDGEEGE